MRASKALACAIGIAMGTAASAATIGYYGRYTGTRGSDLALSAGHTVVFNPDPNNLAGIDTLYVDRADTSMIANNTRVNEWLLAGGRLITESSATHMWFDGRLALFQGFLADGFRTPSGTVCGGNTASVTDPASFLADGLPTSWGPTGDAIGVFQVYEDLDPLIQVVITARFGTGPALPVAATARIGLGTAVMFFSDFGDINLNGCGWDNVHEERLFLNALPTPSGLLALTAAGLFAARRRR